MDEANVIPIGTRGEPGRGTGQGARAARKPSSTSRELAGKTPRSANTTGLPDAVSENPTVTEIPEVTGPTDTIVAPPASTPGAGPAADPTADPAADSDGGREHQGEPRPGLRVDERPAKAGLPIAEALPDLINAARQVFGADWEQRLAQTLAFLRRRITGDFVVDDFGFDPDLTEKFLFTALRPLVKKWFRVEVVGAENLPADGGGLVVANHSGTVPLDGLVTMFCVNEATDRFLRVLGADLVFRLPVINEMARRGGATLACNEDAERMLSNGELVGVWPEGFKGVGKPFSERYKLQRFGRGGFVSAAIRTGVPIIPVSIVGAEEIYPLVGNVPTLARLLGLPYVPVTPFFPLLGPLGLIPLPSKWIIEFGEPIRTDVYESGAAEDPMLVFNVTDQVRESIQQSLYSLLLRRRTVFG